MFTGAARTVGNKISFNTSTLFATLQPGLYKAVGWTGRVTGGGTVLTALVTSPFFASVAGEAVTGGNTTPSWNMFEATAETTLRFQVSSGGGSGTFSSAGGGLLIVEL